jgi:SAM-dependent methyltransferase
MAAFLDRLTALFRPPPVPDRPPPTALDRTAIAGLFLKGEGIEIGALHNPMPVPPGVRVRYVDRLTVADLRRQYPELTDAVLVEPDTVDDGERLVRFGDRSVDFVIANHFLEHCEDPIATLKTFARVLRAGGCAYLAVPDMRHTWDRDRAPTTLDHLIDDHERGPQISRRRHFEEFAQAMHNLAGDPMYKNTIHLLTDPAYLQRVNYSIHFHVWDHMGFLGLMTGMLGRYGLPLELEMALASGAETIAVLRKR